MTGWPVAALIGGPILLALVLAFLPRRDDNDRKDTQ